MRDFLKNLKLNEANVSLVLGIAVVVIVGALLVNYFRSVNRAGRQQTSATVAPEAQTTPIPSVEELPAQYTIAAGDSLWNISQKVYGSGYNWVDVAAANRQALPNPHLLWVGTTITLPKVEPRLPASPAASSDPVNYSVQSGDHLWGIGVKVCNNGYVWSKVAAQNGLRVPNLIYPGQVLKVACT